MTAYYPHGKPDPTEYAPFYNDYIKLVDEVDIVQALEQQMSKVSARWRDINSASTLMLHPPYTWKLARSPGASVRRRAGLWLPRHAVFSRRHDRTTRL